MRSTVSVWVTAAVGSLAPSYGGRTARPRGGEPRMRETAVHDVLRRFAASAGVGVGQGSWSSNPRVSAPLVSSIFLTRLAMTGV